MAGRLSGGVRAWRHKSLGAGEWSIPGLESQDPHAQIMENLPACSLLGETPGSHTPSDAGFPDEAAKAPKQGSSPPQSPN